MTINTTKDYWISPSALTIEKNAMGEPDFIQASCISGAQILVYIKGVSGLEYDAGHNYRRWKLQASPTKFNSHTSKYVYAAVPRNDDTQSAMVVFPSELLDIYGKNEAEEQKGSEQYYYIFLQGILSSSGDNGSVQREWTQQVATGSLSSDEAIQAISTESDWYRFSTVDNIVTFLKDITMKAGTQFIRLFASTISILTNGKLQFGTDETSPYVSGIADDNTSATSEHHIVTPKYLDPKYMRKDRDDNNGAYKLTLGSLKVNGKADIFGNFTVGTFAKNVSGAQITPDGDGEMQTLTLRDSLIVPSITYNSQEWIGGNTWRSSGGGIIKAVATVDGEHLLLLDVKAGEGAKIAANDICQGIYHMQSGNATSDTDSKNGNFTFKGFKTIYFQIQEICYPPYVYEYEDEIVEAFGMSFDDLEQYAIDGLLWKYKTRSEVDTSWTDATHPQPHMNFAVYANPTVASRQFSTLQTPQYEICLVGMTSWTYSSANIRYIKGNLNGFNIDCRYWDSTAKTWKTGVKSLSGYGIAFGKAYMWGTIDQFDRAPAIVSQQAKYLTTNSTSVTYTTTGWGDTPINVSSTSKYQYMYYIITYDDDTTENSAIMRIANYASDGEPGADGAPGADGEPGAQGPSLRPCGLWSADKDYVCDTQWVDAVISDNTYYACRQSNGATCACGAIQPGITSGWQTYWQQANMMQFVATDLLLAEKAAIENLLLNNMSAYPKKADGTWDTTFPTMTIDGNTGEVTVSSLKYSQNWADVITTFPAKTSSGIKDISLGRCYMLSRGYMLRLNAVSADYYMLPKGEIGQMIIIVAETSTAYCRTILGNFMYTQGGTSVTSCTKLELGCCASVTLAKTRNMATSPIALCEEWVIINEHGTVTKSDFNDEVLWWNY